MSGTVRWAGRWTRAFVLALVRLQRRLAITRWTVRRVLERDQLIKDLLVDGAVLGVQHGVVVGLLSIERRLGRRRIISYRCCSSSIWQRRLGLLLLLLISELVQDDRRIFEATDDDFDLLVDFVLLENSFDGYAPDSDDIFALY